MAFDLKKFNSLSDFTRDAIISEIVIVEGGYVNDPNDRGGETIYGITKAVAYNASSKALWAKHGWNGNMRTMPKSLAIDIYINQYWKPIKGDDLHAIHPLLALHVFDLAVNAGVGAVGKHLQRQLNVLNRIAKDYPDISVDGQIGAKTIDALKAFAKRNGPTGVANFILTMGMQQGDFYIRCAENRTANESFMNGWMMRAANKMRLFCKFL